MAWRVQGLLPAEALEDANVFRAQRLYVQDVHAALSQQLPLLQVGGRGKE